MPNSLKVQRVSLTDLVPGVDYLALFHAEASDQMEIPGMPEAIEVGPVNGLYLVRYTGSGLFTAVYGTLPKSHVKFVYKIPDRILLREQRESWMMHGIKEGPCPKCLGVRLGNTGTYRQAGGHLIVETYTCPDCDVVIQVDYVVSKSVCRGKPVAQNWHTYGDVTYET